MVKTQESFQALFFKLNNIKFAIELKAIQEVISSIATTPMPINISNCEGLLNHRGNSIVCKDIDLYLA